MCKKEWLQLGDLVVTKNGNIYVYTNTRLGSRFLRHEGWLNPSDYNEDLIETTSLLDSLYNEWNIVQIHRPNKNKYKILHNNNCFYLDYEIPILNIFAHSTEIKEFDNNFQNLILYV